MKTIKKDLGSFNLHLIQTKKFKTITVRVIFHTPIQKEEITLRNILSDIMLQSTEKYKNRRDLTIASEDLYAADISTSNQRLGNYLFTSFTLQSLQDKYTEDGNFEKSLEFLNEIIFHPDFSDDGFCVEKLDIVKSNAEVALNSIKEDASGYSLMRASEVYNSSSPISYRMTGYLEDLENINPKNLKECYEKMIDNDYVDIFVVGDYDSVDMLTLIKKHFKFKKIKKRKDAYILDAKKCRKRRLFAKETIDNTQSKLVIACPISKINSYERNYSLVLANIILGGGVDSKLFQEVREKNSLCYSIYSMFHKYDSTFFIIAGIDKKNFKKTVDLITENLNLMKKGKFSEKDITVAKEFYHTSIEEIEESEFQMINEVLSEEVLGLDSAKERVTKMNGVTKSDIIKACKKIQMDTVFLLEGVKNEND